MSETPDPAVVELAHQLFDFARHGETDKLAVYLDAGAPVELTGPDGNTLLMLAAYNGQPDTVAELIARGADVDKLNDRGQSPLAGAIFHGEEPVVALLLGAGADPDLGTPSARATAEMFEQTDLLKDL